MNDWGGILVVDHDDESRAAAASVGVRLGYEVLAVEDSERALDQLGTEPPALAIVEVELPGATSGLELLRELHARYGDGLPVILISSSRTASLDRISGLMLGADDYLTKPFDTGELLARARRSLRRSRSRDGYGNGHREQNGDVRLSPREREILTLLANGSTQSQIAALLVISPKTVATHIQHLLAKLDVHSRAQAVTRAFQLGLVAPPDVEGHGLELEVLEAV
jgi:DNA-binding NarL/FixJ family response regulator